MNVNDAATAITVRRRGRVILAGLVLGLVSGSLSGAGPLYQLSLWFRTSSIKSYLPDWAQLVFYEPLSSPAPYVFFAAIATLLVGSDGWPVRRAARLFLVVAIAWIAAFLLAYVLVLAFDRHAFVGLSSPNVEGCPTSLFGEPLPAKPAEDNKPTEVCAEVAAYRQEIEPIFRRLSIFVYITAGVAAGCVGSAIVAIGLALLSHRHRSIEAAVLIMLSGTVAGAALAWKAEGHLALFVIWQAAVTAAIAGPIARASGGLQRS
ncbi:MAG: hypothetical protein WCE79_28475 [Xanthobacteraceae bacterium]